MLLLGKDFQTTKVCEILCNIFTLQNCPHLSCGRYILKMNLKWCYYFADFNFDLFFYRKQSTINIRISGTIWFKTIWTNSSKYGRNSKPFAKFKSTQLLHANDNSLCYWRGNFASFNHCGWLVPKTNHHL